MVDGQAVVESNGEGIMRTCDMMQCGKGAVLAAPSGVVMQETIALALRNGGMQPGDVDALECHAPGALISDAAELNAMATCLRSDEEIPPLPVSDMKTNMGSAYAAAGIIGFLRSLHCMREGLVSANNHLRRLTPHVDTDGELSIITEPMMQPVETTGFSCTNSFGNSGTYLSASVWGDLQKSIRVEESEDPPAPLVTFWPAGGGELDAEAQPQDGQGVRCLSVLDPLLASEDRALHAGACQ